MQHEQDPAYHKATAARQNASTRSTMEQEGRGENPLIWDHIKTQVDRNILDSPYQFIEIQEALAEHDWYKREPFDRWVWGMGRTPERVELTLSQMVGFWRCEGHTQAHIKDRLEYLRYNISRTVDELIRIGEEEARHDLKVELEKAVEGAAA